MEVVYVFIVFVVLILIPFLVHFFEFYTIRCLYKKAYNKKLLYKQYKKAIKIIQNNKINELLYHCNIEQEHKK